MNEEKLANQELLTQEKEWLNIKHSCGWKARANLPKLKKWFEEEEKKGTNTGGYILICGKCKQIQEISECCVYGNCHC